jgi:hypothetical protein
MLPALIERRWKGRSLDYLVILLNRLGKVLRVQRKISKVRRGTTMMRIELVILREFRPVVVLKLALVLLLFQVLV